MSRRINSINHPVDFDRRYPEPWRGEIYKNPLVSWISSFAFSELVFWLTIASKPFTEKCFLKKSYSQADDPGFFAEILDFLSLIR